MHISSVFIEKMKGSLKISSDETLSEFLETNFGSESGITCLSSAPLLLQQCESDLKMIRTEISIDGSVGKALVAAIDAVSHRVRPGIYFYSIERSNSFFVTGVGGQESRERTSIAFG